MTDKDLFLSLVRITVVQTGSTAGDTGPTINFSRAKRRGYNSPTNSSRRTDLHRGLVVMTPNAYMTDKAWVLVSKAVVKGYRSMQFVHDNPQWIMLELLDGFGSHKRVLEAHGLRAKFLVLSTK